MFRNTFGSFKNVECGLVYILHPPPETKRYEGETKSYPIPLLSVDIQANIVAVVGQIQVSQVYVNKEADPIEAIYYFPVDSNGSVTGFSAELDGKIITGVVKPQEEAEPLYNQALNSQKSAFLLESNKPDIFKARIGFLKPGATVKINITYVTEIKNEKGYNAMRFFIPTTVSPRFIRPTTTDKKTLDLRNMTFSIETPALLSINVHVCLRGEIEAIECPSHKVIITSKGPVVGKKGWNSTIVCLDGKSTDLDRDFVLYIIPKEIHVPRLYQEKLENSTVLMTHLIPSFQLVEQVELLFVLDRSGSMRGQSIALAKKALELFLHSLPSDCYFNVIGFGSSFNFLFPESAKYDDEVLKKAIEHAKGLDATLGGTEIFPALKEIYNSPCIPGYLRQIFVITDGDVGNTEQVIGLVKVYAHKCRLFTLGIGDGVSHHLIEGLAIAGGGTAVFASYNESINSKVVQQLKNALQPSLTGVSIKCRGAVNDVESRKLAPVEINKEKTLLGYGKPIPEQGQTKSMPKMFRTRTCIIQVPENIPPIHDGSQLLVFGLFSNDNKIPTGVSITSVSPDGPLSLHIPLETTDDECDLPCTQLGILDKLAIIKEIAELQLKIAEYGYGNIVEVEKLDKIRRLEKQIIDLSTKYNIISNYTSFVATIDSSESQGAPSLDNNNWVLRRRLIPSQVSHGWHADQQETINRVLELLKRATDLERTYQERSFKLCSKSESFENIKFGFTKDMSGSVLPPSFHSLSTNFNYFDY